MTETFQPLYSSHIASATYDADDRSLQVTFTDGQTYEYANVPRETFLGLQNARSAGEYFNRQIKSRYSADAI